MKELQEDSRDDFESYIKVKKIASKSKSSYHLKRRRSKSKRSVKGALIAYIPKALEEEERKYNNNEDFTAFLRQQAQKRMIANIFMTKLKQNIVKQIDLEEGQEEVKIAEEDISLQKQDGLELLPSFSKLD